MARRITITTSSFAAGDDTILDPLRSAGYEIRLNPYGRKLAEREVLELCEGSVGIIAGTEALHAAVLKRLAGLKVISRCGVGMENVDLDAAAAGGVKVYNTPDAPTLAVAELTVGLMLSLVRKTHRMHGAIKAGRWEKLTGNLLRGKHVGIVGFGRIGKKVAELLTAFGCVLAYTDPVVKESVRGVPALSLEDLLKWSDIVTLHVSTDRMLLDEERLRLMKKGSWLVNVSRGGTVDEDALYGRLASGHLAGAALDVFTKEPYTGRLTELDTVVLTPHIGSYAVEARNEMERQAVDNLIKGLEQEARHV